MSVEAGPQPLAASLLDQLLENTKSLPRNITGLGSIQLGIHDIISQIHHLREKAAPQGAADAGTKAHYLLASSGINAEDIAQDLDSVDLRTSVDPIVFSSDTDVDGYLRYRREENIVASIEDSIRQTVQKFDSLVAQSVRLDWNYEKLLICEHFGLVPRGTAASLKAELGISTDNAGNIPLSADLDGIGHTRLGHGSRGQTAGWKKSSLGRSVLGPISGQLEFPDVGGIDTVGPSGAVSGAVPQPLQQQQQQQTRQQRYAAVVNLLNTHRLEGRNFKPIEVFAEVAKSLGMDTRTQQLYDAWQILHLVIPNNSGERKFAKTYCESAPDSTDAIKIRQMIARGSRKYLENQFFALLETEIARYPQEAQLGGIPSVVNKILAYLKLRFLKNRQWTKNNLEVVNNVPIWALLYYLFRSGHLNEALEYTNQNENYFQKIERTFPTYLRAYVKSGDDRMLPRELHERLVSEFNYHLKAYDPKTDDPYKYALYKLLGRCDLARKNIPEILLVAEDWMWVQLMLVQESSAASEINDVFSTHRGDRYTLTDLRNMLVQFGARHFNPKGNNPGVYFQALLLSGQYERAIHYIYKFQPVDAVHFAIVLTYYGLLRVCTDTTDTGADLLTLNSTDQPEINFARLIGYYTRDFRRTDPEIAVDYISLICLNGDLSAPVGEHYLTLCHEALRELVLETRDFAVLLGDVLSDGTREPGIIERKMGLINIRNEQEYLQTITEQAAIQADQDGRTADAVLLYHLSEEYDIVVGIINKTLGESLAIADLSSGGTATDVSMSLAALEDPVQLARNMMAVYNTNGAILKKVSAKNRDACSMLLQIVDARRAFENGSWEDCLSHISRVNVLPMELDNDTGSIRRRAQQFSALDESVARNVPMMLVMAMECCVRVTRQMDSSAYSDASRSKKIGDLRTRAKNCMIYAGMIQYRMPREVYGHLTRMETEL
ncbi:Nup93/Nic96-domain-containing protein [Dipodascopsis uninucleata]